MPWKRVIRSWYGHCSVSQSSSHWVYKLHLVHWLLWGYPLQVPFDLCSSLTRRASLFQSSLWVDGAFPDGRESALCTSIWASVLEVCPPTTPHPHFVYFTAWPWEAFLEEWGYIELRPFWRSWEELIQHFRPVAPALFCLNHIVLLETWIVLKEGSTGEPRWAASGGGLSVLWPVGFTVPFTSL